MSKILAVMKQCKKISVIKHFSRKVLLLKICGQITKFGTYEGEVDHQKINLKSENKLDHQKINSFISTVFVCKFSTIELFLKNA